MNDARITVLYHGTPFPPDRGGKADVWRRVQAFRAVGAHVQFVHWPLEGTRPDQIATMERETDSLVTLAPVRGGGKRLLESALSRAPYFTTQFRSGSLGMDALSDRVKAFDPRAIWIEGPWAWEVGHKLSKRTGVPLLYRSHNIEHKYMLGQMRASAAFRERLRMRITSLGLERFERRALASAETVYDISHDDLEWWKRNGIRDVRWLPPVSESAFRPFPQDAPKDIDVLFLGNLVSPNNLRGVEWLIDEVWPRVRAAMPQARLTVAGSGPGAHIRSKIAAAPGAELLADAPDALAVLSRAKVHANPVLTGSGIQLKTMEMLMTSAPVVSTPQGIAGFPPWLKADVGGVDSPEAFAQGILRNLSNPSRPSPDRIRAQSLFSIHAVDEVVADLRSRAVESRSA